MAERWNQLRTEVCCRCKTRFAMSEDIYQIALERRQKFQFYCPNGHGQHYTSGISEEEKLRQERDRAVQNAAYEADRRREANERADQAKRSAAAYKGAATRMKNRVKAGVCPCCNRTFQDLARHMASKHPDHETESVVEFGQAS